MSLQQFQTGCSRRVPNTLLVFCLLHGRNELAIGNKILAQRREIGVMEKRGASGPRCEVKIVSG